MSALKLDRALVLIYPDAVQHQVEITRKLKRHGFKIQEQALVKLSEEQATDLFQEHIDEPSFSSRIEYVISDHILALSVQKPNLFEEIASVVGPSNPSEARQTHPDSLRAVYGHDTLKNGIYYSESPVNAKREIQFFFPDSVLDQIPSAETAKQILENTIYPVLLQGLTRLCREKPQNPTAWLGQWLLENNPAKPKIEEPAE